MKKKPPHNSNTPFIGRRSGTAAACIIYTAICLYLYHPYLAGLAPQRWITMANSVIGAAGCFVLSRRWIGAFTGSLFAGAVFGFCPLAFGLASYHPLAGVPLAALPWLFWPAAFWRKYAAKYGLRLPAGRFASTAVTAALSAVPFVAVAVYFLVCSHPRISVYPVPLVKLQASNLTGLLMPLAMKPHEFIISVYHVPLPAFLMGLCMIIAARRMGIMVIMASGLALAFSKPLFNQVPPVMWTLVAMLVVSVLVGLGMEALAWAGAADRRWVLFCAAATAVIAGGCLYLTVSESSLYRLPAAMHTLAFVTVCIIYLLERARLRLHALKWTLLSVTMGLDILLCGRYIIDDIGGL